ncbi:unnamed protein product [Leptosia nina]|uniref:Uncharacterized protein n=1 Tax=Leptosia nina TaxID=320188 RepID=A0AAV1K4Q4_9NEOP
MLNEWSHRRKEVKVKRFQWSQPPRSAHPVGRLQSCNAVCLRSLANTANSSTRLFPILNVVKAYTLIQNSIPSPLDLKDPDPRLHRGTFNWVGSRPASALIGCRRPGWRTPIAIRSPSPHRHQPRALGFIIRAITPFHLVAHLTRRVRHQFWGCQWRSVVMDYTKIPYFATFRQAGTVIIRLKMDASDSCCSGPSRVPIYPGPVFRPTDCEQCSRTRSYSRYSDCDSELVDRCRPYRSSVARSRYVNVCAAVCLVLLVGGLSPQSTAAPHKRNMDRQRRSSTEENIIWGNPCDYGANTKPSKYSAKLAKDVASQARNALELTSKYKDKFATLHSYPTFEALLKEWSGTDWLRNFNWLDKEVKDGLPRDNVVYQPMTEEYMDNLMNNIDSHLPSMYKGLKMVVAGLFSISKDGLNDDILSDASLKQNITESMHNVRAVLCLFNDIMRSRKLEISPLPDSELPDIKDDKIVYALLVYRDTLNYLEYLAQVFQKMYDVDSQNA